MRAWKAFGLAALILVWGCPRAPETPVQEQDGGILSDGGIPGYEPFDMADASYRVPECARACANLQRLECPEAERKPGEDSCYVVCRRAQETRKINFKPGCIAAAADVDAVRACGTYRCRR